jgi:hypothetical protein
MKRKLALTLSVISTAFLPLCAAFGMSPGLYNLNLRNGTFSQICLASNLSWYTTAGVYSLSGGHWLSTRSNTNAFGTSATSGVGNISIVFNASGTTANWTEWTSNLSFFNVVEPLKVAFVSSSC